MMNLKALAGILVALILSNAVSAAPSVSMSSEAAILLLYGKGEKTITDREGYAFRFFPVTENSDLQALIDDITSRLLSTTIGSAICKDLLNANPRFLKNHLGMTLPKARVIAAECEQSRNSLGGTSQVFNQPGSEPSRLTRLGIQTPRRYMIVVTDRPDFPIGSWTEAYANQTTLVLHHSSTRSDLNLRYLTQAIAHEMAIYFDAKSWPWGAGWNRIPEFERLRLSGSNHDVVSMAALNPAISTVLSFIRAFKLERQMLRELVSMNRLGPDQFYYPSSEFPFLRMSCLGACLKSFILAQQTWLSSLHRSLLAFSPHYLARKLEHESSTASLTGTGVKDSLIEALQILPVTYMKSQTHVRSAFESFLQASNSEEIEARTKSNEVMMSLLLPTDLAILETARFEFPETGNSPMDALTYLTIPLLSDLNSSLSSGPRPRIRTGATR